MIKHDITQSVWWNLLLITFGSLLFSVGARSIAIPHHFVPGGLFGLSSLIYYASGLLDPGSLYFLLNLPIFIFAWVKVGRRFCLYSLYAMAAISLIYRVVNIPIELHNQFYAAVAAGFVCGMGSGIVLRSLGSNGGLDLVAVWLYQTYNIGIGKCYFMFNLCLFLASSSVLSNDLIVASIIMVFISSMSVEYALAMFNQRKVVLIISDRSQQIAARVLDELAQSATFLKGVGAYSRQERDVLMTVVNNVQLKKLESITFGEDEGAMFIVENTFNVLGSSFSKRKIY
ncbi:MAG: YitT family protein [Desulfovibrionaceae bacterium]